MKKIYIVVLFLVGVVLLGLYLVYTNQPEDKDLTPDRQTEISGKTYTDSELGYSINLPEGFRTESNGAYSKLILPDTDVIGMGPANFLYISVVTPEMRSNNGEIYNYNPDHFNKMIALENIGDSVNLVGDDIPDLSQWYTYTVVAIEDIDKGKAKNFENTKPWEFPSGTTENRFIYGTEKNIYILGYYTGGDSVSREARIDPKLAYQVIKSFKLLR